MNATPERHWAEDGDLLSRYVLERVPPAGRVELERHLTACAECRALVEQERVLAAGIRRAGRDHLRARLAAQVRDGRRAAVPWPRVLAAAAVLLVIAGVLVVPRWLAVRTEAPVEMTGSRESLPEPVSPGITAEPPVVPHAREEAGAATMEPPAGGTAATASGTAAATGSAGRIVAPRVLSATALQAEAPPARMRMKERAEADAAVAQEQEFSPPEPVALLISRRAPAPADQSAIPADGTIPCLYEERGDTVVITVLYGPHGEKPDEGPPELRRIGADSLVIRYPDLHLGLKLPPKGAEVARPGK